jgi:hypothetical protein
MIFASIREVVDMTVSDIDKEVDTTETEGRQESSFP